MINVCSALLNLDLRFPDCCRLWCWCLVYRYPRREDPLVGKHLFGHISTTNDADNTAPPTTTPTAETARTGPPSPRKRSPTTFHPRGAQTPSPPCRPVECMWRFCVEVVVSCVVRRHRCDRLVDVWSTVLVEIVVNLTLV